MPLVFLFLALCPIESSAFTGSIYELASERKNLLYKLKSTSQIEEKTISQTVTYTDLENKLAVTEKVAFLKGKVASYSVDFPRRNEFGELKVANGKIYFSYTKDDKTKTSEELVTDNFVVGLSIVPYIKNHWKQFEKGDDLKIRFGVLDRRETVGFTFVRQPKMEKPGGPLVAKMKATSFIIRALVDPVYFYFDPEAKSLSHFVGRAKPQTFIKGKWHPLDGETVYSY